MLHLQRKLLTLDRSVRRMPTNPPEEVVFTTKPGNYILGFDVSNYRIAIPNGIFIQTDASHLPLSLMAQGMLVLNNIANQIIVRQKIKDGSYACHFAIGVGNPQSLAESMANVPTDQTLEFIGAEIQAGRARAIHGGEQLGRGNGILR